MFNRPNKIVRKSPYLKTEEYIDRQRDDEKVNKKDKSICKLFVIPKSQNRLIEC